MVCYLKGALQTCNPNEKHLCSVDLDGSMSGCVHSSVCIVGDNKKELTCDNDATATQNNCCCDADYCNNMKNTKTRQIFCKMFPKQKICSEYSDNVCFDANNMEESCKHGQSVCQSSRDGSDLTAAGCAGSKECPVNGGEEVTCHSDKCCCNAKAKPCNDKTSVAMEEAMKMAPLSDGFSKPNIKGSLLLVTLVACLSFSFQF